MNFLNLFIILYRWSDINVIYKLIRFNVIQLLTFKNLNNEAHKLYH